MITDVEFKKYSSRFKWSRTYFFLAMAVGIVGYALLYFLTSPAFASGYSVTYAVGVNLFLIFVLFNGWKVVKYHTEQINQNQKNSIKGT